MDDELGRMGGLGTMSQEQSPRKAVSLGQKNIKYILNTYQINDCLARFEELVLFVHLGSSQQPLLQFPYQM